MSNGYEVFDSHCEFYSAADYWDERVNVDYTEEEMKILRELLATDGQ